MAIAFPITVTDALSILPGLVADSSPDVATDKVTTEINADAGEVRNYCKSQGHDITAPTNHQTRLLALCNRFGPQSEIVLRRGAATDPEFLTFNDALVEMRDYIRTQLRTGKFYISFKNAAANTIPAVSLATDTACAALIPSFVPSANTHPSATVMQDLADMFSSIVYNAVAVLGYPIPSNITTGLTADQRECYADIVRHFTASVAVRTRAGEFVEGAKAQHSLAGKLWDKAIGKLNELQTEKKGQIFQ